METSKMQKRKLKNFFTTAKLSQNYHRLLVYFSLFFMAVVSIYLFYIIRGLSYAVGAVIIDDPAGANLIFYNIKSIVLLISVGFFLYFIFILMFVLLIEYRVAGPSKAILKFIEELRNKNYDYVRPLRTGDELGAIMDSLVELQNDLKTQKN